MSEPFSATGRLLFVIGAPGCSFVIFFLPAQSRVKFFCLPTTRCSRVASVAPAVSARRPPCTQLAHEVTGARSLTQVKITKGEDTFFSFLL